MGDEELKFTEEESRCWADDARNQAPEGVNLIYLPVVLCLLFLVVVIVILALNISLAPRRPEVTPLLVLWNA